MALSYTSVARIYDIEPMLEEITDLSSAQIVTFATDAEAEVDAALSRLYTVPVTGGPALLAAVSTDIAIYRVLSRRVFTQERLKESAWPNAFKEARDLLKSIANGSVPLVDSAGAIIAGRTDVAQVISNNKGYHQTFSELGILDQIHDEDKIDDLEDDRGI